MFAVHTVKRSVSTSIAGFLVVATAIVPLSCYAAEKVARSESDRNLPGVNQMIDAHTDVWGDAAMRQPNGASYEFFKDLLPPIRWVNAEFHHYPIVLSAPRAARKVRLISNGSAVNARANKRPMWFEQGVPVKFFVGDPAEPFGQDLPRLETPVYLDGYLPIVAIRYKAGGVSYCEEAFAPVEKRLAALGTAMVRFSIAGDHSKNGRVEAHVDSTSNVKVQNNQLLNDKGQSLVAFDTIWRWDANRKALVADLRANQSAELAIFTVPAAAPVPMTKATYDNERRLCIHTWEKMLTHGVQLRTPEPIVDNAWRSTLIGNFMIAVGNDPNYSAGNAYSHLYEGECGDTLRSLVLYGHPEVAPGMLKPLLEFPRKDTRFHVAGQKLQLLAYVYWLTRDTATIGKYEPLWRQAQELILNNREKESGLLPKDNYAGDIHTQVYSLNSNANCWRGLHDLAAVLDDMGSRDEATKLRHQAADYRNAILSAEMRSERHETKPPFIPISLLADEQPHDPLTATQFGSYYDLICPYIISSEIFGQGSQREDWLLGYLQNHGGIAMGMVRTMPHRGQYKDAAGVNPLYGLRYQLTLLRRDEREKALVGFYGQLAQGMTRGTFIGGEANRFLVEGDANGRTFYLPPNSTSNAAWLIQLRYLLVQDWDLDQDGKPETLRLMYGVPRRWLEDGRQVRIENAPTAFGNVSVDVDSKLRAGYVEAHVTPPPRPVKKMLLRAPLPAGWRVDSVEIDGKRAPLTGGDSVDLSEVTKPISARFRVSAK
ncbi:MAG TPA: hypothetical protein VHE81_09930 [Lacipirellulaceae bacterium]|nr:hypothetical protein [Lacipirellulaceae bacterium]